MKKHFLSASLLALTLLSAAHIMLVNIKPAFAATPLIINGNLVITPSNSTIFEDYDITVNGSVIIQEGGSLVLKKSILKIYQTKANQHGIIVMGRLDVTLNSSIIPDPTRQLSYNMTVKGSGTVSISYSAISGKKATFQLITEDFASVISERSNITEGFITAKNYSLLKFKDSMINPASSKTPIVIYDFSDASIVNTNVILTSNKPLFELYNSSRLTFSDSTTTFGIIYAYNYSKVNIINCVSNTLETYHFSSAIISSGSFKSVKAYNSSMVSIVRAMAIDGEVNAYDLSTVLLHSARAKSAFAYKKSRLMLFNSVLDYTLKMDGGVLGAYDSADVSLADSAVRILNTYQSSTVSLSNVTIRWTVQASSSSTLLFDRSNIEALYVTDTASVNISRSNINILEIIKSPKVYISNCTINELTLNFKSVNISVVGLGPVYCDYWNSVINGTLFTYAGGYGVDITLNKTQILTGVNLHLSGISNASIIDSKLNYFGVYDSTTVYLVNSTAQSSYIGNDTQRFVYWYLNVYVVNGTNLVVLYNNGTAATPSVTAVNVTNVKFPLLEKVINGSTVTYTVDNYILNADWDGGSANKTINLTGNVTIDLTPPKPWQPDITTIALAAILVCVIVGISLLYIKRRRRQPTSVAI
ncbi:MAG: hypothetical protein QXV21_02790 [Candidatus Bathyarchaeia archaeon]